MAGTNLDQPEIRVKMGAHGSDPDDISRQRFWPGSRFRGLDPVRRVESGSPKSVSCPTSAQEKRKIVGIRGAMEDPLPRRTQRTAPLARGFEKVITAVCTPPSGTRPARHRSGSATAAAGPWTGGPNLRDFAHSDGGVCWLPTYLSPNSADIGSDFDRFWPECGECDQIWTDWQLCLGFDQLVRAPPFRCIAGTQILVVSLQGSFRLSSHVFPPQKWAHLQHVQYLPSCLPTRKGLAQHEARGQEARHIIVLDGFAHAHTEEHLAGPETKSI